MSNIHDITAMDNFLATMKCFTKHNTKGKSQYLKTNNTEGVQDFHELHDNERNENHTRESHLQPIGLSSTKNGLTCIVMMNALWI